MKNKTLYVKNNEEVRNYLLKIIGKPGITFSNNIGYKSYIVINISRNNWKIRYTDALEYDVPEILGLNEIKNIFKYELRIKKIERTKNVGIL